MFASSGEVDKFIRGLNEGTIRILPKANDILVDDKNGNKQTLAKSLADAIKEYEYVSVLPTPPPASVTICKAAICEALSYGVVEFSRSDKEQVINVLPFIGDERQLRIEIIPGRDPMARISGQSFSLNGKIIELDFGQSKEKKLEAVYVSNNITNYNINSPAAKIAHNQSTIIDSFDSIIQEVDKSTYTTSDKEDMKTVLQEIKENIESKNIPEGISKLDKLRKYEPIYQMAMPWALKIADIVLKS